MAKEKTAAADSFLQGLLHFGVYKGSQGKVTRQVTFAVLAVIFLIAAYQLFMTLKLMDFGPGIQSNWVGYGVASLVLAVGLWFSYRMVNYPKFADFLIAVEAEMNKVSWPTRGELVRSSIVVIFVIMSLAIILFAFDLFWEFVFFEVKSLL